MVINQLVSGSRTVVMGVTSIGVTDCVISQNHLQKSKSEGFPLTWVRPFVRVPFFVVRRDIHLENLRFVVFFLETNEPPRGSQRRRHRAAPRLRPLHCGDPHGGVGSKSARSKDGVEMGGLLKEVHRQPI